MKKKKEQVKRAHKEDRKTSNSITLLVCYRHVDLCRHDRHRDRRLGDRDCALDRSPQSPSWSTRTGSRRCSSPRHRPGRRCCGRGRWQSTSTPRGPSRGPSWPPPRRRPAPAPCRGWGRRRWRRRWWGRRRRCPRPSAGTTIHILCRLVLQHAGRRHGLRPGCHRPRYGPG